MTPFAAFVIAPVLDERHVAAVTRDTGDAPLGLPGGKVEPGEDPRMAAMREAAEEGWAVSWPLVEVHRASVDGRLVVWYASPHATRLHEYKERERGIQPRIARIEDLAASSRLGNDAALAAFQKWYASKEAVRKGFRRAFEEERWART